MNKDRKCQTTGGLWCLLLISSLPGSVSSQCSQLWHHLQAQGPQPTQQIWLRTLHDSLAELSSTPPRTDRMEFRWKDTKDPPLNAGAKAQPLSQFSQVVLATTQYSWLWMVSLGLGSLYWKYSMDYDGGACPCLFPLQGRWAPCTWGCFSWDCLGAGRKSLCSSTR